MPIASFALDRDGRVTAWSVGAVAWSGYAVADVVGRHYEFLVPQVAPGAGTAALVAVAGGGERLVPVTLGDGSLCDVLIDCAPMGTAGDGLLCEVSETWDGPATGRPARDEVQAAFADALMRSSPFGLGVLDTELRYVLVNDALADFNGIPAREHIGARVGEVVRAADGGEYERALRRVLRTGEPLHNVLLATRSLGHRDRDRAWSVSFFRLTGHDDRVLGLGGLIVDVTQKETGLLEASSVRQRLELVNQAAGKVGTTLEMTETARELTQFAVPEFADAAAVEIREDFLAGGRMRPGTDRPVDTVRLAARSVLGDPADDALFADSGAEQAHPVGSPAHDTLCQHRPWRAGPDGASLPAGAGLSAGVDGGLGSLITVPLVARGRCLGLVRFGRSAERAALDDDDLKVAEELAARTALSLDNARMYEEERRIAVALQRDMLPGEREIGGRPGLDIATHYWSTSRSAKVGGDWFDVIPLSGHRVALVVGDMMGHDIQAAAGMGQLRTAMHTLASLDLEPVDLLTRLDAIVENSSAMQHATCVYAVIDTVTRQCSIVNAGHPPPVLRYRDGSTGVVPVEPGVPLGIGLGGSEFATVRLPLPEDGTLVLYTDGLIERRGEDIDVGLGALREALTEPRLSGLPLRQVCDGLVARLADVTGDDDLAVLMARTPAVPGHAADAWRLPARPASAPRARSLVREALHRWGVPEACETAELLVGELVTNAVRYARSDIAVQLARGGTLVAEVTDDDERMPHLIPAGPQDERGRGLALVDALATDWGARAVVGGKVVWCEMPLPAGPAGPPGGPAPDRSPPAG